MPKVTDKKSERQEPSRRYGKKQSYAIPVFNGILEHREAIGPALWEFIWCLDKITFEDAEHIGWCLGKKPIDSEDIARDLSEYEKTARTNLARLEREGYIIRIRTPRGHIIGVRNSAKFNAFRHAKPAQSERQKTTAHTNVTERQETTTHNEVNGSFRPSERQKTTDALDSAFDSAIKQTLQTPAEPISGTPTIALPNWIPTREWFAFLNQLNKRATLQRQELFVKKLTELRNDGHDPTAILEQSIASAWQSLFPLRNATNKPNPNDRTINNLRATGRCEFCFESLTECKCVAARNHRNAGLKPN